MATEAENLVPLNVAARACYVPQRWLRAEAEAGRVPALKAGSRYVCELSAVQRTLAERATQPEEGGVYEPA